MKKLFFFAALCLLITNASFGQTINVSTGLGTVGSMDPNWKLAAPIPAGATANTYIVNNINNIWQSTPISGSNAQWINPSTTLGTQTPGLYIFERSFTVTASATLVYNLALTFDDDLQSIEIVRPNGTTIPLTVVRTQPYFLSRAIDGKVDCAEIGEWKIRVIVNYMDYIGGFMLSGSVNIKPQICCSCGKWNGVQYQILKNPKETSGEKPKVLECNKTLVVKTGYAVKVNPTFKCEGTCKTTFKATLTGSNGTKEEITQFPYVFTKTEPGNYHLSIVPTCGETKCAPCTVKLFVTPGCHGDVIEPKYQEANQLENTLYNGGRG